MSEMIKKIPGNEDAMLGGDINMSVVRRENKRE